ncbi:MAG: SDR family oxidoreductase [Deltaproteobacteria bacterium]|nr:SDR family oxidoreductase [Deltaproteobacteria bacterium]
MNRFEGKVVVITGGNSGIGFAAAARLRDEGAQVVIIGRNAEKVAQAAKELGDDVVGLTADVAKTGDLEAAYGAIKERFGRIDTLFANAGVAFFAPVSDVTEEFYDQINDVNQKGLFFTIQKALSLLGEGSSVVITTSVVNQLGLDNGSVYAASKAAARNLARGFARELASRGIRVNAVAPGPVETPIFSKTGMPSDALDDFAKGIVSQVPLQRFGKSEEIAAAVAFLGSSDASYVTGAELAVDGGMTQL